MINIERVKEKYKGKGKERKIMRRSKLGKKLEREIR